MLHIHQHYAVWFHLKYLIDQSPIFIIADKYFIRYKNSNVIHIQEYVQDTIRIIFCQVPRKKKHYPPVIIASNMEIVIASTR